MLVVATANVNGVRAAVRRGMGAWLAACRPDVVALQEVRADDDALAAALGDGWHVVHREAGARGRAGVAVASRTPLLAERDPMPDPGRWVEADVAELDGRPVTVVSAYVHTGEAGTARQDEKLAFLRCVEERVEALRAAGHEVLVTGDLNVAHAEVDLKNWRGNRSRAGFLPEERAVLSRWFDELGWVDLGRRLGGEGPGPYTWWSWRGRAYDNDAGWRIDYQLATPALAARAVAARVDRAPTYEQRWSDHAPVVVTFDLPAPDRHRV